MTNADRKERQLAEYYRRVDAMDVDGFLSLIAEDAKLTLGNDDPVVGRDDIAQAFGGLLGAIKSSRHVLHAVYDLGGDLAGLEGDIEFVRQDGKELSVRFANFVEIGEDGVIREQRLTVDFAPLFA